MAYQTFELKRSQKARMKTIATLSPPATEAAFLKRYQEARDLFPLQLRNESQSLSTVWEYIAKKRPLESLAVFRNPAIQIAMGLAWLDQEVESGKLYEYQLSGEKISPPMSGTLLFETQQLIHEPFWAVSSSRDADFPLAEWQTSYAGEMIDYHVFRRGLGEKAFQQIFPLRQKAQQQDSIRLMMTDTTLRVESIYEYYIVPFDILGNQGRPSQRVQAGNFGTRSMPIISNFRAKSEEGSHSLRLSWSLTQADRVRSLRLYRSRQSREGFELIRELAPMDSSFTDQVDEPGEGYFYFLQINDITGKDLRSVTIFGLYNGSDPADAPVRLLATPEKEGIQLHWQGKGANTRGYYVFRAEGYRGELRQISAFIPAEEASAYLDTAQLSGSQTYSYAVKAENKSYELSEFSARVSARPVAGTSLSPPLSIDSKWLEGRVRISWDNLYEREAYLEGYFLYRKEAGAESFSLISQEKIPFQQNYVYDKEIEAGKSYQYAVQAVDGFGAKSSLSKSTEIQIPLPNFPERLGLTRQPDGIRLSWNIPSTDFLYKVQLLRSEGEGRARLISDHFLQQNQTLDQEVKKGEIYTYHLRCVDAHGKTLSSTDAVSIRF